MQSMPEPLAMYASAIWVLIADTQTATICARRNGVSEIVYSVTRGRPCATVRDFAASLADRLDAAAEAGTLDELIIVASEEMMEALRETRSPRVAGLVISEIVEPPPSRMPSVSKRRPEPAPKLASGAAL